MRPSPPLGTTGEAEYSPGAPGTGRRRRAWNCAWLVFQWNENASRFTTSTWPKCHQGPNRPSAAAAGPPAVLDAGRTTEPTTGEPGPDAATRTPRLNERLGAGTQVRCPCPGRPPPPAAHGRQRDGDGGPPHRRHGPRKERPGPGTGGFPPNRRPARTRLIPTAVRSGLPRRERGERGEHRSTARASRTSRSSAA